LKIIVGLGNPSKKYLKNRHNIGMMVLDAIVSREKLKFKKKGVFAKSEQVSLIIGQEEVTLIKPLVYMNLSGISVKQALEKFRISLENLLIICDDINLPFGKFRLRTKGTSGGHNGLLSIIETIGTQDFNRLRIGIDKPEDSVDLAEYVLSDFSDSEQKQLPEVITKAIEACDLWLKLGTIKAMESIN